MRNFKIAISLRKDLLKEIEELADEMRISKNQLLEMAAREFVQNHKGKKSLQSSDTDSEDLSEIENEAVDTQAHSTGSKLMES